MRLEYNEDPASGGNRSRARNEKSPRTFVTPTYTFSGDRRLAPSSGCAPRKSGRRRRQLKQFWTDCPHCDLDNMLGCDAFEGDQLFHVTPVGGLWALFHCRGDSGKSPSRCRSSRWPIVRRCGKPRAQRARGAAQARGISGR